MTLFTKSTLYALLLLKCSAALTQKYNFINYNIDDGLLQSQVNELLQDNDRHIWMSTSGGISRFDGTLFTNYTTREGLCENNIWNMKIDTLQRLWAITSSGLNLVTRNRITVFPLPERIRVRMPDLEVTADNRLWCLMNSTIYLFRLNKLVKAETAVFTNCSIAALTTDAAKNLYVLTYDRNIYKYVNGVWSSFTTLASMDSTAGIFNIYIDSLQNTWVLTSKEIFVKSPGKERVKSWFKTNDKNIIFLCFSKDRLGNTWLGANRGAFKIGPGKDFIYFNNKNGFTDCTVNDILTDVEGNVWLGTDGSGLYRYPRYAVYGPYR